MADLVTADEALDEFRDDLAEENPGAILFDGLETALVGWASQYPTPGLAVYDADLILEALEGLGMTETEARDWFEFNIADLYAGPGTPLILRKKVGKGA